jgi:hypothetical protein
MRAMKLRPSQRLLFQNREWAVTTRIVTRSGDGKPGYWFR